MGVLYGSPLEGREGSTKGAFVNRTLKPVPSKFTELLVTSGKVHTCPCLLPSLLV